MSERPLKHPEPDSPERARMLSYEECEAVARVREEMHTLHERLTEGLTYHGISHIHDVESGVEQTFDTWGIPVKSSERAVARLAASAHDLVQASVELPNGERFRLSGWRSADVRARIEAKARSLGQDPTPFERYISEQVRAQGIDLSTFEGNEKESATLMRKIAPGIPEDILAQVDTAIKVTVPRVVFSTRSDLPPLLDRARGVSYEPTEVPRNDNGWQVLTIEQDLPEHASCAMFALALNDLMLVGRAPFDAFLKAGNEEFRESNELLTRELAAHALDELDTETLARAFSVAHTPEAVYAAIALKALAWTKSQVGFAWAQKARFIALSQREPRIAQLGEQFSHFDDNCIAADAFARECREAFQWLTDTRAYTGETREDALKQLQMLLNERMGYTVMRQ